MIAVSREHEGLSMKREFICLDCGRRDEPAAFGLMICCPDCNSHRVADAEIWDRFGGGKADGDNGAPDIGDM